MKILHYVLIGLFAFIIGGCAVKVDLQEYKDVSRGYQKAASKKEKGEQK